MLDTFISLFFVFSAAWVHAAASDTKSTLDTLAALKKVGYIPGDKKASEKQIVLAALDTQLTAQDKICQLMGGIFAFDASFMDLLAKNSKKYLDSPNCDQQYLLHIDDPDALAFVLHYHEHVGKAIFGRELHFSVARYREAQTIFQEWQDHENTHIRELVKIARFRWDTIGLTRYNGEHFRKPCDALLDAFAGLREEKKLKAMLHAERGPLRYLNACFRVSREYASLIEVQNKMQQDATARCDIMGFMECTRTCKGYALALGKRVQELERQYQEVRPLLMVLQADARKELQGLGSTTSFIKDLPCVRQQRQQTRRQQPGKKKRVQQHARVVAGSSSGPCSSQDPRPEEPVKPSSTEAGQDDTIYYTPEDLLAHCCTPLPKIARVYNRFVHPDGSYTTHENDIAVTIHDHPNNTSIKLFKVDNPQQEYVQIDYTPWVQVWFDNPAAAMEEQGYNDPTSTRFKYRDSARRVHAFTPLVDRYLSQCSTKATTYNKKAKRIDTVLTMPGMMAGNFGIFTLLIDSANGKGYHRNFVKRDGQELLNGYADKGYYEVEFPELK
jgi:hypothetical protein